MTLEELEAEDLTLRHVLHDLEKQIQSYREWLAKNDEARRQILDEMHAEHSGISTELVESLQSGDGC